MGFRKRREGAKRSSILSPKKNILDYWHVNLKPWQHLMSMYNLIGLWVCVSLDCGTIFFNWDGVHIRVYDDTLRLKML